MRKTILACVVGLMASTAAYAEGVVGFEFGLNYMAAPTESSLEGYAKSFTLSFPMNETLTVGIRHEEGELDSTVGAVTNNFDTDINQLVLTKVYSERVGLSLGLGYGTASRTSGGAASASAIVGEVAVPLFLMSDKTKFGKVDIKLTPSYRMFDVDNGTFAAAAGATNKVEEFGGFNVALSAAVTF